MRTAGETGYPANSKEGKEEKSDVLKLTRVNLRTVRNSIQAPSPKAQAFKSP